MEERVLVVKVNLERKRMRRVTAAIDAIQAEDLRGYASDPRILFPGQKLEAQLTLVVSNASPVSMRSVETLAETHAIRCNLREFFSQPLSESAITHAVGQVVETNLAKFESGKNPAFPEGSTNIEILLSAEGVQFLLPIFLDGQIDAELPRKGDLLHVCGIMECLPSFSTYRLHSPTRGRITDTWKCTEGGRGKWRIWGLVRLELDSRIRVADLSVTYVHGGDGRD
jgi:hypothetical protein